MYSMKMIEKSTYYRYKQVKLGNIADIKEDDTCKCHPDVDFCNSLHDELEIAELVKQKESSEVFDDSNKIVSMIELIHCMFEGSVCGYPCLKEAKRVHTFWWNKLSNSERKKIRDYISTCPTIREGDYIFNWVGGWKIFSFTMCGLYKLSFETN
jgi:hypothetical protein